MNRLSLGFLGAAAALAFTVPADAQMNMPGMPGMKMPMRKKAPAKKSASPKKRAAAKKSANAKGSAKKNARTAVRSHAKQSMARMPGMTMKAGQAMQKMPGMAMPPTAQKTHKGSQMHNMPGMQMPSGQSMPGMTMPPGQPMPNLPGTPMSGMEAPSGTDLPAGNVPPPPIPTDHAADYVYPPAAMAAARKAFRKEDGGQNFYRVLVNLGEFQARKGGNGYRWDGEAWVGGDINRLWLKSEGEGTFDQGTESAEAQVLYSRAIGPYFNLQAGVRHDFAPTPTRTYAALGVEGMAPLFFDTETSLFISTHGDVLARATGWYDQLITQRLVLQPRVEANFAAQDVPEEKIGSGLSNLELGLRLRYEIRREFAPYFGISYSTRFGRTASFALRNGEAAHATSLVLGVRTWF